MARRPLNAILWLLLAVGAAVSAPVAGAGAAEPATVQAAAAAPPTNPIVLENRHQGTTGWRIPWSGKSLANDSAKQIKGYASDVSVDVGESIDVKVTVNPPGEFTWHLYRLGWYAGLGGRQMASGTATGITQPPCVTGGGTGLIECGWSRSVTLGIDPGWTSGVYVVVLTRGTYQNYVLFAVRDDARTGALLHMTPVNTYQAYNNYPDDGVTGKSLYDFNSYGATTMTGAKNSVKVSFSRPYAAHGAGQLFNDDVPMIRYQESRGWDVKYVTNVDLHRDPNLTQNQEGLISVGHDEYWTAEMFTAAEATRDGGVDVAFLGGNDVYWQARLEPAPAGAPHRVLVCYRNASQDPETDPSLDTLRFRDLQPPRPEQTLMGLMWPGSPGLVSGNAGWTAQQTDHWFYRGTGLTNGAKIPYMIGGEADNRNAGYPSPEAVSGSSFVLARSSFTTRAGGTGLHEATIYQAPSGAFVFSAGTWHYTRGVGGEEGQAHRSAQAMTSNLLARFGEFDLTATTGRAGGADRYETAVMLSQRAFSNPGVPVVFLATGQNYPDALAASAASRGAGPVLLVETNRIPAVVQAELGRLDPQAVFVVGGAAVVSESVRSQLTSITGVSVGRLAGADRFGTAVAVSKNTFAPGVPVVYVATGLDYPDALEAGAAGAQLGGPVLLTSRTAIDAATRAELDRLNPARIAVVGGTGVVSSSVQASLSGLAPHVVRLAGPDRYETSREVTRDLRAAGGDGAVVLATGLNFPDALAAGPAVGALGGSLVLVGSSLDPATAEEVVRNDPATVIAAGGTGVVSNALLDAIRRLFDVADGASAPTATAPAPVPQPAPTTATVPLEELEPPTALPWLTSEADG